ncbi:MAG: NifB/NifX family molybdenum-iron cluster-binding protein [Bacteroidales bacterium]|jgi:predicted Fe-Mo cluster-binding NifX family protein
MNLKIAIPTDEDMVDNHFGHCDHYTIFEIDEKNNIVDKMYLPAGQGCGCKSGIAAILNNIGVKLMLAGSMGDGAKNVLEAANIQVIRGCSGDVTELVQKYLNGAIKDSGLGCTSHEGNSCGD